MTPVGYEEIGQVEPQVLRSPDGGRTVRGSGVLSKLRDSSPLLLLEAHRGNKALALHVGIAFLLLQNKAQGQ